MIICTHHSGTIQSIFTALKFLCALPIHSCFHTTVVFYKVNIFVISIQVKKLSTIITPKTPLELPSSYHPSPTVTTISISGSIASFAGVCGVVLFWFFCFVFFYYVLASFSQLRFVRFIHIFTCSFRFSQRF